MKVEQLVVELGLWQQASMTAVGNIYALYEHPTYRALAADLLSGKLCPHTLNRVAAAVASVPILLSEAVELKTAVERAVELHRTMPTFFQAARISQIEAILTQPIIVLTDAETSFAQRGLLTTPATEVKWTLTRLLESMLPRYELAKAAIMEVDNVWMNLDSALHAANADVLSLLTLEPAAPDLIDVQFKIQECRASMKSDPIGAGHRLNQELNPALRKKRAELQAIFHERAKTEADLKAAQETLRRLEPLHAHALTVAQERRLKVDIAADPTAPVPTAQITDLTEWLRDLENTASGADWRPASVGLRKWLKSANDTIAAVQKNMTANAALLERRLELRGLLEALKAKAAARGVTENTELGALGRSAKELLLSRPTPMRDAERQVSEYQARVNSLVAKQSQESPKGIR